MAYNISPEYSRLIAQIVNRVVDNDKEAALKNYIRLVITIAKKYVRPNVEYEDLISVGCMGLLEAVDHFDENRSKNFKTYATTRIIGRMYEYCVNNTTNISVPTHVGKTRVYIEKMNRVLGKEPYLFSMGIHPREIICSFSHPLEIKIGLKAREEVKSLKEKVNKIAVNSKTTYEVLIKLAYESIITELGEEDVCKATSPISYKTIEDNTDASEVVEMLEENLGKKHATVLILHHLDFNNEDIADELYRRKITPRRISRQAVRGLLRSAKSKVEEYVNL